MCKTLHSAPALLVGVLATLWCLTLDHVDVVGPIPDGQGHGGGVSPDQLHHRCLLPGGHPATQHRLAPVGKGHEPGPQLWLINELRLANRRGRCEMNK